MQLTSLLVLFSAALANTKLQLSAQDLTLWSQLSASVAEINDKDCSGEIAFSFQQAQAVYERYGLSDQFLESLKYVSLVSGDIDEAAGFRNQWTNATVLFGHHYSLLKNSTAQVILDKYPAAPKATQAAGYKDGAYGAQAVTDEKHALYGVMSNAFTYSASAASAVAAAAFYKVQELEKQLEHIMKELQALKTSGKFTSSDIEKFQNEIHSIDEKWQDGAIKEEDGSIQPGQADLSDWLNDCHELIADLLESLPDDD